MTTRQRIEEWLRLGIEQGYTHVIIVCDEFDHEDFPVFIKRDKDVKVEERHQNSMPMHRVMEIYNLSLDLQMQLSSGRARFY